MLIPSQDKQRVFFLFASFLILISSFGCRNERRWHSYTLLFFDTFCDVKVRCPKRQLPACQEEVRRAFTLIERCFSPGHQDLASPPVLELYQKALLVYRDSGGAFDITVGPLSELWGFSSGAHRIPRPEEIKEAQRLIGMGKIRVEGSGLILNPGMKLDWGGIAKGWGVDLAASSLLNMGILDGFINAGGDLRCWGHNPDGKKWRIGVKNPRGKGYVGVIETTNTGVATSGDYQRYFESDGRRYHHIFDPATGYPAQGKMSVTVIGPEVALCDALATALFVSSEPETIIRHYPSYGAILVDAAGGISQMGKSFPFQPL